MRHGGWGALGYHGIMWEKNADWRSRRRVKISDKDDRLGCVQSLLLTEPDTFFAFSQR